LACVALTAAFTSTAVAKPPPKPTTLTPPTYYDANGKPVGEAVFYSQPDSAVLLRFGNDFVPLKLTIDSQFGGIWSVAYGSSGRVAFDQPGCTGNIFVGGLYPIAIKYVAGVARDPNTGAYTLYLAEYAKRVEMIPASYYDQGETTGETICVTLATATGDDARGFAPLTSTFELEYAPPFQLR